MDNYMQPARFEAKTNYDVADNNVIESIQQENMLEKTVRTAETKTPEPQPNYGLVRGWTWRM